jgi:hypothetical protein
MYQFHGWKWYMPFEEDKRRPKEGRCLCRRTATPDAYAVSLYLRKVADATATECGTASGKEPGATRT